MPQLVSRAAAVLLALIGLTMVTGRAQTPAVAPVPTATRITPNLADASVERPLRYHPEGTDFVIENGGQFFNRPLYGGNTAFRVDAGDVPEFSLYLPGRGGNLRIGLRTAVGAKWLHQATRITARYRPGEMLYEIRDPLLGAKGVLQLVAVALRTTEGLVIRADLDGVNEVELVCAFGGANGQRGRRDGDIGTEDVPIGEYFQLKPEFCRGNKFALARSTFTLASATAMLHGIGSADARWRLADAADWESCERLLASDGARSQTPVVVSLVLLQRGTPRFLGIMRVADPTARPVDLEVYRDVTAQRGERLSAPAPEHPQAGAQKFRERQPSHAGLLQSPANLAHAEKIARPEDLPLLFADAEAQFAEVRNQLHVETPDAFINTAVGALNVAADAVWDEPEGAIMHGAIAWRTKLLGWRGPYALDALGWTNRARRNFTAWAARQNTDPIPVRLPPADAEVNLARSETALHSNGDLSNSHYDMNAVFVDALFRHLRWTGDWDFAREMWPMLKRHLAWERRLFRREFGPDKLPLYEAYAMIWASDDLQYSGGGAAHASAYNFWHNQMAARLARVLGDDPKPYEREALLIARGMHELLWMRGDSTGGESGHFAEYKDLLGRKLVHPSAALWTYYHTIDSAVATPDEARQMTRYLERAVPQLPVRGRGVPTDADYHVFASSDWMPYTWSINNVVMGENVHTALAFWQAERPEEAFRLMKSALLASMFMGVCPGNVGSMNYLDVYRRESQRDFADGSGVLSRAIVEGLFGVRPDALAGELRIAPGFPASWDHASLRHPLVSVAFHRSAQIDTYEIDSRWRNSMVPRLALAMRSESPEVTVNGRRAGWTSIAGPTRRIEITCAAANTNDVTITWNGAALRDTTRQSNDLVVRVPEDIQPVFDWSAAYPTRSTLEPIALTAFFNDRVTEIFRRGKYVSPRSPFVSLALPSQGIGAWAGHVNARAEIDDDGLRRVAAANGGRVAMPNGVWFATPGPGEAPNVCFTSQWDNYPQEIVVPIAGRAKHLFLLMAGSTNPMQSRLDNGEVVIDYADGTACRLALRNPETWWPIEQDYFVDDYQFRLRAPFPPRVNLKTGDVRLLDAKTFKGRGGAVSGGAATVLELPLDSGKELRSLTVRALANDVVIGLMAATLARE